MDRYPELLAILDDEDQVAAHTDEELAGFQAELLALASALLANEQEPPEGRTVVEVLAQIADYAAPADGGIAYVLGARAEAAAQLAEQLDEQRARLGLNDDPEPEPAPEVPAAVEAEPTPEPALAAVPDPAPSLPPSRLHLSLPRRCCRLPVRWPITRRPRSSRLATNGSSPQSSRGTTSTSMIS